jgi:hypothetical protein
MKILKILPSHHSSCWELLATNGSACRCLRKGTAIGVLLETVSVQGSNQLRFSACELDARLSLQGGNARLQAGETV